jgi:hypothetical protein
MKLSQVGQAFQPDSAAVANGDSGNPANRLAAEFSERVSCQRRSVSLFCRSDRNADATVTQSCRADTLAWRVCTPGSRAGFLQETHLTHVAVSLERLTYIHPRAPSQHVSQIVWHWAHCNLERISNRGPPHTGQPGRQAPLGSRVIGSPAVRLSAMVEFDMRILLLR